MIVFSVDTPTGFVSAVELAKGAFLPRYQVICKSAKAIFGADPKRRSYAALQKMMGTGDLADCQSSGYRTRLAYLPGEDLLYLTVKNECFFTPDRAVELHRRAARLAKETARRAAALPGDDLGRLIRAYQQTLRAHFTYRQTGAAADYSAYHLVMNGHGVCQAFAALTLMVLPRLGFPCRYVRGTAGTLWDRGSHAWNLLFLPGRAPMHADFTFGLSRPETPTTATEWDRCAFRSDHQWATEQERAVRRLPHPRFLRYGDMLFSPRVMIYKSHPFTPAEQALLTMEPERIAFEGRAAV